MKKVDPRVLRTRRLLIDALIDLVIEKGYEKFTVRDIVDKAAINRSTFYLHFRDKQDALHAMTDTVLSELAAAIRNPSFTYEAALRDYVACNQPIYSAVKLFEHVQKYAQLYHTVLAERNFREQITESVKTELLQFSPTELEASFVSNGIIGAILYWIEHGMVESIQEMSLWLTRISLFPLGHDEKEITSARTQTKRST